MKISTISFVFVLGILVFSTMAFGVPVNRDITYAKDITPDEWENAPYRMGDTSGNYTATINGEKVFLVKYQNFNYRDGQDATGIYMPSDYLTEELQNKGLISYKEQVSRVAAATITVSEINATPIIRKMIDIVENGNNSVKIAMVFYYGDAIDKLVDETILRETEFIKAFRYVFYMSKGADGNLTLYMYRNGAPTPFFGSFVGYPADELRKFDLHMSFNMFIESGGEDKAYMTMNIHFEITYPKKEDNYNITHAEANIPSGGDYVLISAPENAIKFGWFLKTRLNGTIRGINDISAYVETPIHISARLFITPKQVEMANLPEILFPILAIGVFFFVVGAVGYNHEVSKGLMIALGISLMVTSIALYFVPEWFATWIPLLMPLSLTVLLTYLFVYTKVINSETHVNFEYWMMKNGDWLSLLMLALLLVEMWFGIFSTAIAPIWGW